MEKIKNSFTRVLLFVFLFNIVLVAMSSITDQFSNMVVRNAESPAWNGITAFLKVVITVAVAPLYVGFYRFCFERANGRKPRILTVFDLYRSAAGFVKSAAAYLVSIVSYAIFGRILSALTMMSIFASRDENTGFLFVAVIIALALFVLSELFFLTPYAYAESLSDGLAAAIKKSVKLGFKFIIVLILLAAAEQGISALVLMLYRYNLDHSAIRAEETLINATDIFNFIILILFNSLRVWIEFTVVYMILGVSPKERNAADEAVSSEPFDDSENKKEKPFIEPYDFFIEADERFNDEKIIETEDIRGVDILAVLDEMNLADDVKIDFAIRKKLKKMFEELSFEIGEYVTYAGGREIENDFTEEIDEREFEVSVEITRNSDYEPFKLTLRVNMLEEE